LDTAQSLVKRFQGCKNPYIREKKDSPRGKELPISESGAGPSAQLISPIKDYIYY
jgi:hypothetical protein